MSKEQLNKSEKILIVGPAWVGDMVMSQSLYQLLKQQNSDRVIDVLAPAWSKPLLECMSEVNEAIPAPFSRGELKLSQRYALGKMLRARKYDQAIVLPNSFKSAFIPFFAKIPKRTGWRGEMRYGLLNDVRILDKVKYPLMIERFMALAVGCGEAIPKPYPEPRFVVDRLAANEVLQQLNLDLSDKPILAICPGAQFGPSKR